MPTVVLSPIGGAGQQFFDNNGNVLSGGLLYTYAAGTTTPATTYTTSAGTVARTNPVVLDSAGRVSGDGIWLVYETAYKFVLKNSTGATTYGTWDNISGSTAVADPIVYDIREYGALTSLANNTTAINLAIAAASAAGGGDVFVPGGTWPCTTQITLLDGVNLIGAGYDSHLSFASAGAIGSCIAAAGSMAAVSPVFNTSIVKGDDSITFGSAPNVVAGDIILLFNSANSSWSAARPTSYKAGEFCRVSSVSGSVVSLESPVFDSYTTGSTTIAYKVTPVNVAVANLRCTFKANLIGINVEFGYKCHMDTLDLTGSDVAHIQMLRCYESTLTKLNVLDSSVVGANDNYGISLANSQRVLVSACHLVATRHGLAMGGDTSTGCVPTREVMVTGCIVGGRTAGVVGADMHGNVEFATYQDCELTHGVILGGDNNAVINCLIRPIKDTSSYGVYAAELLGPNHVIRGNRIVATADLTGTAGALINISKANSAWTYTTRSGVLTIADNDLDLGAFDGRPIDVRNTSILAATATIDLVISGNRIHGTGNQTARVLLVTGNSTCGFRSVQVSNNHLINTTISIDKSGAQLLSIRDNTSENAAAQGVLITGGSAYNTSYQTEEELILIERNTIHRPNACGIQISGSDTGVRSYVYVKGNTAVSASMGGTTSSSNTDSSLYALTVALLTVEGNTFGKMPNDSTGAQSRSWNANTVTNLYDRANVIIGTVIAQNMTSVTNRYLDTTFNYTIVGAAAANILTCVVPRRCIVPVNAPGSYAKASANVTATHAYDIQVNGVSKGTITWDQTTELATFTWATAVALAAGDRITVHPTVDATLVNIGIAISAFSY